MLFYHFVKPPKFGPLKSSKLATNHCTAAPEARHLSDFLSNFGHRLEAPDHHFHRY